MYSEEEVLRLLDERTEYCSNKLEEDWSAASNWFRQLKKK